MSSQHHGRIKSRHEAGRHLPYQQSKHVCSPTRAHFASILVYDRRISPTPVLARTSNEFSRLPVFLSSSSIAHLKHSRGEWWQLILQRRQPASTRQNTSPGYSISSLDQLLLQSSLKAGTRTKTVQTSWTRTTTLAVVLLLSSCRNSKRIPIVTIHYSANTSRGEMASSRHLVEYSTVALCSVSQCRI